jgi:hypothetical protein
MTWEDLLAYGLAKPGAWQGEPWEGDVVAKVGSKIFAFFGSGTTAEGQGGGWTEGRVRLARRVCAGGTRADHEGAGLRRG